MNFKLISIAKDAGYGSERWNSTEELEMFLERYGKLIVQECINRINRVGILEDIEIESDMIADDVKEHFGVEE